MNLKRDACVLLVLLAGAAGLAYALPMTIGAQRVFTGAILLFLLYLGVSRLWPARAAAKANAEEGKSGE